MSALKMISTTVRRKSGGRVTEAVSWFGPVQATADSRQEAESKALLAARRALCEIDRHRGPRVVVWADRVAVVFPLMDAAGKVDWAYSNPRSLSDLSGAGVDPGHAMRNVGHAGYYESAAVAASACLAHMAAEDRRGKVPHGLLPKDEQWLRDLWARHGVSVAA